MSDKKKRSSKENGDKLSFVKIAGISFFGVLVYFFLIVIFSLISLKAGLDSSLYLLFGMGAGVASGFVCGFICAGEIGHSGMLYGGIAGFIDGIICSLALFSLSSEGFAAGALVLFAVILVCACAGGIVRVNIKKRVRY